MLFVRAYIIYVGDKGLLGVSDNANYNYDDNLYS